RLSPRCDGRQGLRLGGGHGHVRTPDQGRVLAFPGADLRGRDPEDVPLAVGAPAPMTRRRAFGGAVLAAAALSAAAVLAGGGGSAHATTPPLHRVGTVPASKLLDFTLYLRVDQARLDAFLRAVDDPRSDLYRHYLTPEQFGERFGISKSALARVVRTLEQRHVHVLRAYPQRTALRVRATAGAAGSLLKVVFGRYRIGGTPSCAPATRPRIPASLSTAVVGVDGLTNAPRALPLDVPLTICGPDQPPRYKCMGLDPKTAAKAYGAEALHNQGINGQGQTVAII